jgi:sugar O-acyltransferase (sialic acid O-acetyltransferase NeuD family)
LSPTTLSAAPLHVAGTGSFALEIVEYARAAGRDVAGLIELHDPTRVGTVIHGLPVVAAAAVPSAGAEAVLGSGGDRPGQWKLLSDEGWCASAPIVHPTAHVSPSAELAGGCVVGAGVVVGAATRLAPHVLLGRGALVGHHVVLGDGVVLNPGANVAGNTRVGAGARIGMGAMVANGIAVGARAVVAAGAVVVRPVPDGVRVQGVPARVFAPAATA